MGFPGAARAIARPALAPGSEEVGGPLAERPGFEPAWIMNEPARHTLAWLRRIDLKLKAVTDRLDKVDERLGRIEDGLMVTSAICLRLVSPEVEGRGLLAMLERLDRRIGAPERRS